ncbi:MAG: helix-turn-helix domain-containing protein [Bacteroidota bacterium]
MNFSVREYQPSAPLKQFVDCFWKGTFNLNGKENVSFRMIPNACLELIIHLDDLRCNFPGPKSLTQTPDYMLIGLFTETAEVHFIGTVLVFTIRLKPEALFSLFSLKGTEVFGRYEDISLMLGSDFRDFCHRIREKNDISEMISFSEQYLMSKLKERESKLDYVGKAAELMRYPGLTNIKEISNEVCISERQLERKFREIIGIGPKHYLRLTRINRVLKILEHRRSLDLTSVAYHCGYFDQAHFIKDFKKITGKNPTLFFKQKQQFITLPGEVNFG